MFDIENGSGKVLLIEGTESVARVLASMLFICVVELVKVIPVMSTLELAAFSVADSSPICAEK